MEISNGELLDRLSILQIKSERLDDSQTQFVTREIDQLHKQAIPLMASTEVAALYENLLEANRTMWDAMQAVYDWNGPRNESYTSAVRNIIDTNADRAVAKRKIDLITESPLREAKSFFGDADGTTTSL